MKKYVYMFPEGNGKMRELLGGKGANLAEMTGLGMPVPQGFTITTEACTRYYEDGKTIYPDIQDQILLYLDQLEKITGKTLGDPEKPLLVSCLLYTSPSRLRWETQAQPSKICACARRSPTPRTE